MIRTYKYHIKLSKAGHEALARVFQMCADLYNACLEERIDCGAVGRIDKAFQSFFRRLKNGGKL